MYQVFITGYRLVEVPYIKPYYVYTIKIVNNNHNSNNDNDNKRNNCDIVNIVEKRYSEFNTLHRTLKKDPERAPFPPKKVRNSQVKVLEQRRSVLESYLQKMIKLSSTKQHVLNFLGIENSRTHNNTGERMNGEQGIIFDNKQSSNYYYSSSSSTTIANTPKLNHHPVLTFQSDPYVRANATSSLPDIVTNGVLVGVYKS